MPQYNMEFVILINKLYGMLLVDGKKKSLRVERMSEEKKGSA